MKNKRSIKKILAVTMAVFMLPWSSFMYGDTVEAKAIDLYNSESFKDVTATSGDSSQSEGTEEDDTSEGMDNNSEADEVEEEIIEYEDFVVSKNTTLNEDIEVASVSINEYCSLKLNGHTITCHGDIVMNYRSELTFENGEILCDGSFTANSRCTINMNNLNDYLFVEGRLELSYANFNINSGCIESKGDVYVTNNFRASANNTFILSGEGQQTISQTAGSEFGNVIVKNYSEEGIVIDNTFNYANLQENGCKISLVNQEGISGYTLTEDEEKDGLFILSTGTLDLNGHTLTINGDFIHSGGKVKINNGKLIVNGSYRMQKRVVTEEDITYEASASLLEMNCKEDYIQITNDLIVENSGNTANLITEGIIEVLGNISIDNSTYRNGFVPSGSNTIMMTSDNPQSIEIKGSNGINFSHINNLTLSNTSKEGVTFVTPICISGIFNQGDTLTSGDLILTGNVGFTNESYSGNIIINETTSLAGNLTVQGDVTNNSSLTVSGSLSISGDYYNNNYTEVSGSLYVLGNIEADNKLGRLILQKGHVEVSKDVKDTLLGMGNEEDYILVCGNYTSSDYNGSSSLVNGTLEVKGDIDSNLLKASGNHRLLLSGDKLQTISNSEDISLAILELNNKSEDGVYFDKVVAKRQLIRNDCRLRFGDLEGEFGWTLTEDQVIDGNLVIIDDELNLNGFTLHIKGDLLQMSGNINVNGGELIVDGDYRMQSKDSDEDYSMSTSTLTMINEEDKVTVKGDYYVWSSMNNSAALTNGVFALAGDLDISENSNIHSFHGTSNFKLVLNGTEDQNLSGPRIIYIPIYEISCKGTVKANNLVNVSKEFISTYNTLYSGTVFIENRAILSGDGFGGSLQTGNYTFDKTYHIGGDLICPNTTYIKADMVVDGDFLLYGHTYLYNKLDIKGDFKDGNISSSPYITLYESSELNINRDLLINRGNIALSDNTELHVSGNFNVWKMTPRFGTIYVGGDFSCKELSASGTNKVVLCGDKLQTIDVSARGIFNTLELQNESDDGVVSKTVFNKAEFIRNNTNFRYEGLEGVFGYTLDKDEVIDGDLILLDDTLDLNGHNLTVKGELLQMSGSININKGTLTVEGDYRQELQAETNDSISSSKLIMTNEEDRLVIGGDFIINTSANNKGNQTNGTIELGGDLKFYKFNNEYGFYPTQNLCLKLTGKKEQSLMSLYRSVYDPKDSLLELPSLQIVSEDEDYKLLGGLLYISKSLEVNNVSVEAEVTLRGGSKLISSTYNGNITVNTTLTDKHVINGNISGSPSISGNVTVNGSGNLENLSMKEGALEVSENLSVNGLYMTHDTDKVTVHGNYTHGKNSTILTNGELIVGGKFVTNSGLYFYATSKHKVILNGTDKQTISNPNGHFATLELQNYSSDGVYSESTFKYDKLIKNGCKLSYAFGSTTDGFTLEGDYTHSGDLIFLDGEIDLNGHTLTVEGNLIHAGGTIKINGGKLIVKKDLREQSPDGTKYIEGQGTLVLENDQDTVIVEGNAYLDSNKTSQMNKGSMYIGGNLDRTIGTVTFNFDTKIILNSKDNQRLSSSIEGLSSLDIRTQKTLDVYNNSLTVTKSLSSTCKNISGNICVNSLSVIESPYYGNISLNGTSAMSKDVEIIGALTVNKRLDINNKNLYVTDLTISGLGSLTMDKKDSYICVTNNMTVARDSNKTPGSSLKEGSIEINGNLNWQRTGSFNAQNNHKIIMSPKKRKSGYTYKQSITFPSKQNVMSKLNILILRGKEEDFSFSSNVNSIAKKVIYEYDGADELLPVTDLSVIKSTENAITIGFIDNNVDPKASGYEIYRNGVKVGTTDRTEYTDRNLKPNTKYKYSICAIDSYWNTSAESETLDAQTEKDTASPSVPKGLHISSRTGNTIGVSWAGSSDNVGVTGYILYKDGEELVRDSILEYSDNDVSPDKVYKYEVSAIDAAGNESDKCEAVSAAVSTPKINSVSPSNFSRVGGDSIQLKVFYRNYGEQCRNTVNIEYMNAADEWVKINDAPIGQTIYSSAEFVSSYNWNIGNIGLDTIKIRYTLTDSSGAEDVYETEYEVDNTAPDCPEEVEVVDDNGVNNLSWKISGESDFSKYIIYRYVKDENDTEELYSKVAEIDDRYDVSYTDDSLEEGDFVKYIVTAADDMGNESPRINPVSITVGEDLTSPEITGIEPEGERIAGNTEIVAYAKDNKSIESVRFYIFSDETEDSWTFLGEDNTISENSGIYSGSIDIDTKKYEDGKYYIAAVAVDNNGNESEEDFYKRYEIDNLGIEKIKINKTNVGATYVQLMWDDVADKDFAYFSVEQMDRYSFREVAQETNITGTTISSLSPEVEYTFRVCGVDSLGNKGEYSEVVTVKTLSDTTAPSITAVYPVQGRVKDNIPLSMTVTDNYVVAGGTWYLSFDGENYTEITSLKGFSSKETFSYNLDITDVEKYPEGSIYIKSEAVDVAGNKNLSASDGSDIVMEYIIDRTAPSVVKNVSARASDGYIGITWDESSEEDVAAYKVYKADMDKGNYHCVMNSASLNYYDTDIDDGKSYAYYVTAVDEAGNESEKSVVSFATAIPDETIPKIEGVSPSDGSKIGASTDFSIIATDNSGLSSIKTYYRTDEASPWILLNESSASGRSSWGNFSTDLKNEKEGYIYFKTICEDRNGNVSDDYFYKLVLDKTAPKADIVGVGGNFEIYVDVKRDISETDISYYEIYRCELSKSGKNTSFFDNAKSIEKISLVEEEQVEGDHYRRVRFTDTDIVPHIAYRYAAKVYDSVGNYSWTEIVNAVADDVDMVAPEIVMPDKITTVVGMEVDLDAANCTDNVKIKGFKWDLGNGDVKTGARPKYIYNKSGNYTVKLTVTDYAGNSSDKEIEVSVKEASNSGICNLTVVDYDGNPIPYAYVYVNAGADSDTSFMTDAYGKVSLCYKSGTYKVAAFKDGYLPEEGEYTITNMKTTEEILMLSSGEVVVGSFEVKRMSLQEIVDAGVDLSSPANLNTFTFKTTLTFQKNPIPIVVEEIPGEIHIDNGDDVKPGGSGYNKPKDDNHGKPKGNYRRDYVERVDCDGIGFDTSVPVIAVLSTTQSVSWLKTMYSATLNIINNADSKYVIEDSKGSISLPDGVSLAVLDSSKRIENGTKTGQKLTYDMGNIEGQKTASVSWTLKGDKTGTYNIDASFSGILTPFNVPVSKTFRAETEMEVQKSNVKITVMPEDAAYMDEEYYIQYAITNNGTEPLYNFTTSIGDYKHVKNKQVTYTMDYESGAITGTEVSYSGRNFTIAKSEQLYQTPVLNGEDTITIPTLNPGQTIYGTWQFMNSADETVFRGDHQREYYKLINSLVEVIEGSNLGVSVSVNPIPAHVSKIIRTTYKEEDTNINTGDPIDLTSGSYTDNVNLMTLIGRNTLSLDLKYDSQLAEYSGECGNGWVHDFESKIVEENGMIFYYICPSISAAFISKDSYEGKYYGDTAVASDTDASEDAEKTLDIELSDITPSDDIEFVCISHGMEGYTLVKHNDGTYTLKAPNGSEYGYDVNGNLISIKMEDGSETEISHTEHQTIIKEKISGVRIILDYDEAGNLVSVSDDNGRKASLVYSNGNLVEIIDILGNSTTYQYDDKNRLVSSYDSLGNLIIENAYDDKGRTIRQKDLTGTVIEITYEDLEDGGLKVVSHLVGEGPSNDIQVINDEMGRPISIKENEQTRTYEYDAFGNILSEKSSDGKDAKYSYDEDGRLLGMSNEVGTEISLEYSENGEICRMASGDDEASYQYDDNGNFIGGTFDGKTYKYTYDANNLLSSMELVGKGTKTFESKNGRFVGYTDELGNKTSYSYDGVGNIVSKTDALGNITKYEYDGMSHLTKITDARGNSSTFSYDIFGNLIEEKDSLGNITRYEYDAAGRLSKEIYPDESTVIYDYDRLGNLISKTLPSGDKEVYEYDTQNRIVGVVYPDGTDEKISYTSDGKISTVTDAAGNTNTYEYSADNLSKIISNTDIVTDITYVDNEIDSISSNDLKLDYSYDENGNLVEKTDALGNTTKIEYNQFDEKTADIDANGNTTSYEYDAAGNQVATTYPNGLKVDFKYDALGHITEASLVVDGKKAVTKNEYDEVGNLISYIDEYGNKTSYEYDSENNLISVKNKNDVEIQSYQYDSMGRVTVEKTTSTEKVNTYDISGNLVKTVEKTIGKDTQGNITEYQYDKMGRLLQITDPSGNITSQTYDKMGNITSVTDAMGGVTEYSYDQSSRLVSEKNPIGSTKTYTYDEYGNIETVTNSRGQKTNFSYDANGRLIKKVDEVGTVLYEYDANGNLTKVSDEAGSILRTYDSMNRVVEYTDVNGRTVKYGYDELGNIVSLTYPGGEIVRYSYNLDGTLANVIDGSNNKTSYEYDKEGKLTKLVRPDGSVEERTYDDSGNLTKLLDKSSSGEVLKSTEYTYDAYGNILSSKEGKSVNTRDEEGYSYYIKESEGIGCEEETDSFYEDEEVKDVYSEMEYDSANRLISFNGEEVKYDADGNMIYGPLNGEMVEFSYDARNRLISVGDTRYFYDAENYRYKVETDDYTEEYVTDKVNTISRTLQIIKSKKSVDNDNSDSIVTNYYYGTGLLYDKCREDIRLYHFNHIGNTTLITDKSGNSLYRSAYGTYGELLTIIDEKNSKEISVKELNSFGNVRFLFNGELGVITDDNSLLYMRQRYYNTEIKRFINQDVLSGSIENSQSLNRYAFVEGNPVSYTDPFGLSKLVETLRTINTVYNIIQEAIAKMDTHDVLNILGLLPVVGPVFDLCNAAYYMSEKDWGNAAMSLLFTIPGTDLVGTAAKISPYLGKFGKYVTSTAKFVKLVGTGTAAGVTAYRTGTQIANLIDTYATEGKEIDVNFFLQLGEIGLGLAATASFGKSLAADLEKYTNLEEKLEYAANAIKKEANRLAKDNTGAVKLPGKTIDGDDIKPSTSSDSSSSGKSEAGSATKGGSDTKLVKPEAAVLGSKKHGINWKEGPARAKNTGKPQGQWANSDLDFATEMANTLQPGESGYFDLPQGSESIVHMPDGTTKQATRIWIRNNGTGTWHGYPME